MILNKDRMRVLAHQWRYLVLFGAMIAAVSVLLSSNRASQITAQPAAINSDEQILIAMVRQVAEGIPRQINRGGPSPNPSLKFKDFIGASGEPMWLRFDGFVRRNLTITRVDVDDFHVKINGAEATVDFLGTIYFKDPVRGEENHAADRYTVEMVKVNGRWLGVPLPPPPPRLVERVLDDNCVGIGPDGEARNKAEVIAEVKRLDYEIKKFEFDDLSVSGNEM